MLASNLRSLAAGAAILVMAACGGDDNAPPETDPVVGSWELASMDGITLPVQLTFQNGVVFVVNTGSALAADGSAFTATYNGTVNGTPAALQINGTWARNGSTYLIAGTGTLNGVAAGTTSATATLSGNTLLVDGSPVERWVRQ